MNFSWKITVTAFLFALGMCGMSYWQWTRYLEKEKFLKVLDSRLHAEIAPLSHYIPALKSNPESVQHYRVLLQGEWDFDHEIIKRNRRDDSDGPGVHIITPLRLPESNEAVLVDRGYIPLSMQDQEKRSIFRQNAPKSFVGLLKVTEKPRSWFSPNDPPSGKPHPWVDRWLRIDIDKIQKQVPYELLPVFVEVIHDDNVSVQEDELVKNSKSREEIFYISDAGPKVHTGKLNPNRRYPVPAFSTVVPTATHLLYVFEWAFMAIATLLGCVILQLRRLRSHVQAS